MPYKGDEANDWEMELDEDPPEDKDCYHCGGDGYVECRDPIQCTRRHDAYGMCPCGSCGGSGLAKDMKIW